MNTEFEPNSDSLELQPIILLNNYHLVYQIPVEQMLFAVIKMA